MDVRFGSIADMRWRIVENYRRSGVTDNVGLGRGSLTGCGLAMF